MARELVTAILSTYPTPDVAHAWQCLDHNGGVEGLFLAYYEDSDVGGDKRYRNFRVEGPGAVFYFRGAPHVHAFSHVAMDADAPLGVGAPLGDSRAELEGVGVKSLFEAAMLEQVRTDLAFYPLDAVAGRLRKGPLRTGDIFALESWQDHVVQGEINGKDLSASFAADLRGRGVELNPRRTYSVSTTGFVADDPEIHVGAIQSPQARGMLRDVTVAHLRKRSSDGSASRG
jgi:hypothetical protein